MARSKPTRTITLTYAAYDQPNNEGTLYPCFIAPRYILHKLDNNNAFTGLYTEGLGVNLNGNNTLDIPYPSLSKNCIIDTSSVKVKLTNTLLCVAENLSVSKHAKIKNCFIFANAIAGEGKDASLNGYDVRPGDTIKIGDSFATITDIRASKAAATVSINDLSGATVNGVTTTTDFKSTSEAVYVLSVTGKSEDEVTGKTYVIANVSAATGDIDYGIRNAVKFEIGKEEVLGSKGISVLFDETFTYDPANSIIIVRGTPEAKGIINEVYINNPDINGNTATIYTENITKDIAIVLSENYFTVKGSVVTIVPNLTISFGDSYYKVRSADINIEFRELITEDANMLVSADIDNFSDFVGEVSPDNPLSFMAYCGSLAKTEAFYVMSVAADTEEAYMDAINAALKYENVFAPITYNQDEAIIAYLKGKLREYNSPEVAQFRKLWIADNTQMRSVVYDKTADDNVSLLATMTADGVVTLLNGDLVTAGVKAGDILVINNYYNPTTQTYSEETCKITTVIDKDELTVDAGSIKAFNTPMVVQVVRDCSKHEYAERVGALAASNNSAYINYVWADHANCTGYGVVNPVYLCATLSAMRSSMAPHAPLSEVAIPGWTVSNLYNLSEADLDIMNNKGVWIVYTDRYGETITRHQLTTVQNTSIAEEDSAVSNACNIVRSLRSILYRYRGISNVTNSLTSQLKIDLITALEQIKSRSYPFYIGSQLLDYTINELGVDPDNAARIIVDVNLDVPEPLLDGNFKFNII